MQNSRSRENCVCVYVLREAYMFRLRWCQWYWPERGCLCSWQCARCDEIADVHTSPSCNVVVAIMLRGKVPKGEDVVDSRVALKITQICWVLDFVPNSPNISFAFDTCRMKFFSVGGEHFCVLFVWSRLSGPPATAMSQAMARRLQQLENIVDSKQHALEGKLRGIDYRKITSNSMMWVLCHMPSFQLLSLKHSNRHWTCDQLFEKAWDIQDQMSTNSRCKTLSSPYK